MNTVRILGEKRLVKEFIEKIPLRENLPESCGELHTALMECAKERKMKNAKELRQHHHDNGEASSMGPACPGCGKMQNEGTVPSYRGFCDAFDDNENGWSVICPDCGERYWGYYIWVDPDGAKAVWPFDDPDSCDVKCEPEHK
jgi:hypothetical protein